MVKKLSELYLQTRRALRQKEDAQSASLIAQNLVCHVTGLQREQMLANPEYSVNEAACRELEAQTQRILHDEPLAYVLGEWEFYGLELYVEPSVLIPRDDTCAAVALAIEAALYFGENPRILDLCTGSGCIGLALADRVKDARVTLADISKDALAVAKKNTARNKLSGRVSCVQANALESPPAFLGRFDMIVSNPPYVTTQQMAQLPPSVKDYEPHLALHGGEDGLEFYRAILENYTDSLKPGGYVCFEFGMGQSADVCSLLRKNNYTVLQTRKDYNDRERAVLARYGG